MGVFDAYSKKSVLSPTNEEAASAQRRVKNRGKQRAEAAESDNFELLVLMKEIREEMRGKYEQLREELRWRDNHQEEENKKRENSLIAPSNKEMMSGEKSWLREIEP